MGCQTIVPYAGIMTAQTNVAVRLNGKFYYCQTKQLSAKKAVGQSAVRQSSLHPKLIKKLKQSNKIGQFKFIFTQGNP